MALLKLSAFWGSHTHLLSVCEARGNVCNTLSPFFARTSSRTRAHHILMKPCAVETSRNHNARLNDNIKICTVFRKYLREFLCM